MDEQRGEARDKRNKIRVQDYKTVRGGKTEDRMLNGFGLGAVGTAWNCRVWSRRGAATSETRPKMTNRFWDA